MNRLLLLLLIFSSPVIAKTNLDKTFLDITMNCRTYRMFDSPDKSQEVEDDCIRNKLKENKLSKAKCNKFLHTNVCDSITIHSLTFIYRVSYSIYDFSYSLNPLVSLITHYCFGSTKSQVRILSPRPFKTQVILASFQTRFLFLICLKNAEGEDLYTFG